MGLFLIHPVSLTSLSDSDNSDDESCFRFSPAFAEDEFPLTGFAFLKVTSASSLEELHKEKKKTSILW